MPLLDRAQLRALSSIVLSIPNSLDVAMERGLYVGAGSFRIDDITCTVGVYRVSNGYSIAWECARCRELVRLTDAMPDFNAAMQAGEEAVKRHYAEGHGVKMLEASAV
jgi:hypothetical protein